MATSLSSVASENVWSVVSTGAFVSGGGDVKETSSLQVL
jgi:hypothetical protein